MLFSQGMGKRENLVLTAGGLSRLLPNFHFAPVSTREAIMFSNLWTLHIRNSHLCVQSTRRSSGHGRTCMGWVKAYETFVAMEKIIRTAQSLFDAYPSSSLTSSWTIHCDYKTMLLQSPWESCSKIVPGCTQIQQIYKFQEKYTGLRPQQAEA